MFKDWNRDQDRLLPPNLREMIPLDDLVYAAIDVMDQLDYSPLINRYDPNGQHAFHPKMMLTLLVYAYAKGIFSSRKIAERLNFDVRFMYLSGYQTPDFRTISYFRKDNLDLIMGYFVRVVQLSQAIGQAKLQFIAIDGTKLHASASGKQSKDKDALDKELAKVEPRIAELMAIAEQADSQDTEESAKTTDELQDRQLRREKLLAAKALLDSDQDRKKVNLTDPECRDQRSVGPGYNAQIAVDGGSQIIVAVEVVIDRADSARLIPMIEQSEATTGTKEQPKQVVADSGYETGEALFNLEKSPHLDTYVASQRQDLKKTFPKPPYTKAGFTHDSETDTCVCPQGVQMSVKTRWEDNGIFYTKFKGTGCSSCPVQDQCTKAKQRTVTFSTADPAQNRMREKMKTPEAKEVMRRRAYTVEPVFGHLKTNIGFRWLRLRGLVKANGEVALLCLAYNLFKIYKYLAGRTVAKCLTHPA